MNARPEYFVQSTTEFKGSILASKVLGLSCTRERLANEDVLQREKV